MKKLMFVSAVIFCAVLSSCGYGKAEATNVDSVAVDSVVVDSVAVDSVAVDTVTVDSLI